MHFFPKFLLIKSPRVQYWKVETSPKLIFSLTISDVACDQCFYRTNSMHYHFAAGVNINCKTNFYHKNESNLTCETVIHDYKYTAMVSALVKVIFWFHLKCFTTKPLRCLAYSYCKYDLLKWCTSHIPSNDVHPFSSCATQTFMICLLLLIFRLVSIK